LQLAQIFLGENPYSIKEVLKQGIKADLIIDMGKLKKVKPSTIFDVEKKRIIREGPIKLKEIERVLKNLLQKFSLLEILVIFFLLSLLLLNFRLLCKYLLD
jgi:hypothetical protein